MKNILSPGDGYLAAARSGRRMTYLLLLIVLVCVIYYVGIMLGAVAVTPLKILLSPMISGDEIKPSYALVLLLQNLVVYVWPYLLLWVWLRFYEQRPLISLGLRAGGVHRGLTQCMCGIGAALVMVAGWIAVQAMIGNLAFEGWIDTGGLNLVWFGVLLVAAFLGRAFQISIEEVLFRGWVLQNVGARYGPLVGVLFSSAFFATFHFINPLALFGAGRVHDPWPPVLAINIFLWAVFAALWTLHDRSAWAAIGFHTAALWSLGAVFGVGGRAGIIDLRLVDPSWLTGGTGFAGPFEGLPATALLTVGIAVMLAFLHRRAARENGASAGQAQPDVEQAEHYPHSL